MKLLNQLPSFHPWQLAQDALDLLEEAINRANFGRKGPVWLDIPLDIQSARIKPENINPKFKPLKSPPISQLQFHLFG